MHQPVDKLKIRLSFVGNPVIGVPAPTKVEHELSSSDLRVQYDVQVGVDRTSSMVEINVLMVYLNKKDVLFSGTLTSRFEVFNLASYITVIDNEDAFRLENDFFPMLISIAFGNTRGYFARELVGTVLEPYPFPMISMESIRKKTSYELK